jgi:electron transfer flavoprotein alpha/beta subunit
MKVLVAVKRVVDFNVKVRVKADQSGVAHQHSGGDRRLLTEVVALFRAGR